MKRSFTYAALVTALVSAACSDNTPTTPELTRFRGSSGMILTPLEQYIQDQIDLQLPKGFEDAVDARWASVQRKKLDGDMPGAVKQLNTLSAWIIKKTADITPPAGETKSQAAARLILNMSNWLYLGATAPVSLVPNADVAVQVVPAGAAATVQTPSKKAAVSLVAGSTNEERIIVVVEDETSFPNHCQGPLDTSRCQYPRFYHFESFPDNRLNTAGRFAVCHVKSGDRAPGSNDPFIRLAHDLPANPADYTDGSVREPSEGGGIEILPRAATQNGIVDCDFVPPSTTVGLLGTGQRALYALATFASGFLSPKNLYAYDSGPEHFALGFSNFNAVDASNGVLIYGPSMSPAGEGASENEQTLARAENLSVTVATVSQWSAMTSADFARYRAIIFGDPTCSNDLSLLDAANANKAMWSSVIQGPIAILGTDPIFHQNEAQAPVLVKNSIRYAASVAGKTGLSVSLSCFYYSAAADTPVNFLSAIGEFRVTGQGGCPVDVTIETPLHTVMHGLTNAGLSNWSCSAHDFFRSMSTYPAGFQVLAKAVRAPDTEGGLPESLAYIIARPALSP